jgi:hypothetical protein
MLMAPLIAATLMRRRRASLSASGTASAGLARPAGGRPGALKDDAASLGKQRARAGLCVRRLPNCRGTSAPDVAEVVVRPTVRIERVIRRDQFGGGKPRRIVAYCAELREHRRVCRRHSFALSRFIPRRKLRKQNNCQ